MKKVVPFVLVSAFALMGCMAAEIIGQKPDGNEIRLMFYPGGSTLDDLGSGPIDWLEATRPA
ncbi:hypothetical protein [Tabrizicola soli]|uniref:Tripartite tricarboxylate transporter substrate binding protein n=1 Tax=Tabrizicola soli TaxID=2185115 RepID=A0ABV7DY97_9RHOB|nr:hypothetical protein [Tabrizicola soli]